MSLLLSTKTVSPLPLSGSLCVRSFESLELDDLTVLVIEGIQGNGLVYFALTKEKNSECIVPKKADSLMKLINTGYTKKDIKPLLAYPDGTAAGLPHAERSKFRFTKLARAGSYITSSAREVALR